MQAHHCVCTMHTTIVNINYSKYPLSITYVLCIVLTSPSPVVKLTTCSFGQHLTSNSQNLTKLCICIRNSCIINTHYTHTVFIHVFVRLYGSKPTLKVEAMHTLTSSRCLIMASDKILDVCSTCMPSQLALNRPKKVRS